MHACSYIYKEHACMLLYWVCCHILGLLLSMHLIAFTITIYVLCCSGFRARTSPLLFVAVVGAKQWRVSRGSSSSSSRCRWSHACRDRQKYSSTSSKTFTYFRRVGLLRRVKPSPHDLVTLDFAQVAAFGAILKGSAAAVDTMTGNEMPATDSSSSKEGLREILMPPAGDGGDDPDDKNWKGI